MRLYTLTAVACLAASNAAAACFGDTGTPLFHCTLKDGTVEVRVCLQDDVAYYSYGPTAGSPDVVLVRPVTRIGMTPWPGIGRTIWEEAEFVNGSYRYRVAYAVDKMEENEPVSGYLTVSRDGEPLAELTCDRGSVSEHDLYALFEAKEAAGQCFAPGEGWFPTCE